MEYSLDSNIEKLKSDFKKMCETVMEMLRGTDILILKSDKESAMQIIKSDKLVDDAEMDIEHGCMRLLLRNQPFARDFREISCILKAITDIERIGDQASDIANITLSLDCAKLSTKNIVKMSSLALKMVKDSIESLINEDTSLAEKTEKLDDEMDLLFTLSCDEIVETIKKDPDKTNQAAQLLMIAKYYERIGDHAVNICEWTEFENKGIRNKFQ